MVPGETFDFTIKRVPVTFVYSSDVNYKTQVSRHDFIAAVEEAAKLLEYLLPTFPRSQSLTILLSPSGHSGVFHPSSQLAAPLVVAGSMISEALPSQNSHSILKHEIGHLLLENRFFHDERLPLKFRQLAELQALEFEEGAANRAFEDALWPMRFQSLQAGFSGYKRPPEMSEAEFQTRLNDMAQARERLDKLRGIRNIKATAMARGSNEPYVDDYKMKVAAAVLYSQRFLAFTEFFANLIAQVFETHPGDFNRVLELQARDQVHSWLIHDRSLERSQRDSFPMEDAVRKNTRRLRMLRGFSGFVTNDGSWVEELTKLRGAEFQDAVFAPLREWIGKNVLPSLVKDSDRVKFTKLI